MKLNASIKYQLADSKKSILVFYTVILSVITLTFFSALKAIDSITVTANVGGIEGATIIFLFIVGLNSFKDNFRMLLQNGVSRKTMFKGFILTSLIIAIGMSLIGNIILQLGKLMVLVNDKIIFLGMFEELYGQRYIGNSSGFQINLEGTLFWICVYSTVLMIGYFITVLYYRMNKGGKIAVSVGVPVFLMIGLPIIDLTLINVEIYGTMLKIFLFAFGFFNGANPYYGMVTCILIYLLFSVLSWLLIRKAVVRS